MSIDTCHALHHDRRHVVWLDLPISDRELDLAAGTTTAHELGPDVAAGEAVFVPGSIDTRTARAEDDGQAAHDHHAD